jgi:hypothetical protein
MRTLPARMKKDSEIDRWKCGSGPLGCAPISQRYRPNWPLVDAPVPR